MILLALATHLTPPYARPWSQERDALFQKGKPARRFYTDVTNGPFPWWTYLQSQQWGQQIYQNGIKKVWLVLLRNESGAFYMETKDGATVVITPGQKREMTLGGDQVVWD